MATLCHRSKGVDIAKKVVKKVKDALPRQMFEIAVQASLSGKIIARETVSAMRKNVLAKCYGGDVSRKKKLLQKQKDGKKRMRRMGNVDIPARRFRRVVEREVNEVVRDRDRDRDRESNEETER